jgi:hypothetical protein
MLTAHCRTGTEGRMKTETKLERGRPARIGLGINRRHDGVHVFVRMVVDAPQRRKVDGVGAGDARGVQRR